MAAATDQIAQVLKKADHPHPLGVAPNIVEWKHHPHLQDNAITTFTKSRLMLVQLSKLLPLIEQIAQHDKEIHTLFLIHEDHEIFENLHHAGKRLAPRLLAEIGDDRKRDLDASLLQALGGTSPVLFQSGMYSKADRRMACVKPLRNALHQFARNRHRSVTFSYDLTRPLTCYCVNCISASVANL